MEMALKKATVIGRLLVIFADLSADFVHKKISNFGAKIRPIFRGILIGTGGGGGGGGVFFLRPPPSCSHNEFSGSK